MALDAFKNFVKATVSTGYSAGDVSITLASGTGSKFAAPSFNAVWWNSTDFPDPSDDPFVEVVRVTAVAGDVLTITRGQESTAATAKNLAGKTYTLHGGLTAKTFTDVANDIAAPLLPTATLTTLDTLQAVLYAFTPTNNKLLRVTADIIGSTPGVARNCGYTKVLTYKCVAGVVTQIGSIATIGLQEEDASTDATMDASSGQVRVLVTPPTTVTTVNWACFVKVLYAPTGL